MAITIEKGWSLVQPFTVLGADGVTVLDSTQYVVPPGDVVSGSATDVRVTLLADNRSIQLDALGNAGAGSNVTITTRVGGVVHNLSELVTITAPVDRSGPVFGTPGTPFRTPA